MDILTHTLSGVAAGIVVSTFTKKGFWNKTAIVTIGGFGGALPDFDAISLWSKFDTTIGKFFNLSHSGAEIYSGKFFYSHHAFLHSVFAAFLISFLIGIGVFVFSKKKSFDTLVKTFYKIKFFLISFILGFIIHLTEDMPTPSSSWSGVNFLWPSSKYIGGTGDIWWWNNYDVFLIVLLVILISLLILAIKKYIKFDIRIILVSIFVFGTIFSLVQIKNRDFNFNNSSYVDCEMKSKEIQKEILGEKLFYIMESFDNNMNLNF